MKLPRYPAYQSSGFEWLGNIPAHWDLVRLKRIALSIEQGWSPQCESFPAEAPDEWGIMKVGCVNGGIFRPSENKKLPAELQPMPQYSLKRGDLLISRANTRELVGSAAVVPDDFDNLLLCDKLYRLRTREGVALATYLAHYLGTPGARSQIELEAAGASSSMLNIGQSAILDLPIPLPGEAERTRIAAFLDRETTEIDALIAEQEKLIDLLAEKRQATISHAVTKGLDPAAPMKDSGVAWLGEVPAHWDVTRLKYATDAIVDCPHETPTYDEGGPYRVIRTADVSEGRLHVAAMYSVAEHEFLQRIRRMPLEAGDIVYGREGERWGFAAQVTESEAFCLGLNRPGF